MNGGDYESHRSRQMREARDSFAAWLRTLSPAKRSLAEGVGAAADDHEMANGRQKDLAEAPVASHLPDMADEVDGLADVLAENFTLQDGQAQLLAQWMEGEIQRRAMTFRANDLNNIAGVFIDTKNPKLFSAGLAFAADLSSLNGLGNQADFARMHKLTRQAVSKVTKFWQKLLGLPPSSHMKSEAACKVYSEKGKQDHWRRRKASADSLTKLSRQYKKK